ncbi:Enoyl-CoA hydratase [hydrothermal vent metagenome]|uniref:Enoyl-CoA hydratase n=1 Tax=hydrothermal vent metagenome TaxID=652676 RepID=A0A3B0TUW4_9ZZZZ
MGVPVTATIEIEHKKGAAVLRLSNQAKLNALTGDILRALPGQLDDLAADEGVAAVIVIGTGSRAFCAGADINEWSGYEPFEFAREWIALGHRAFDRLASFPKPVIAAVNGLCFGGGLELAGACDMRVASASALFGLPEASIGISPGWSGVQRLARSVPDAILREMALTGARLSAARMAEVGFVNTVVDGDPLPAALEIAARVEGLAPRAVEVTKAVLNASAGEAQALLLDQLAGALLSKTEDMAEGAASFRDKRKPEFKGR